MKKILSVILLLALSCTVLLSCGSDAGDNPIDALYNSEWTAQEQYINKCEEIKGVTGTLSAHNDGFLVFRDASGKNAVTYVWSNYENKIVGTYADTDTLQNNISLPNTLHSAVYLNHKLGDGKASLTMYDGSGKECEKYEGGAITDVSTAISCSENLGLLLFRNKTLYQENGDGTVTKLRDFTFTNPPVLRGSGALQYRLGENYYTVGGGNRYIKVYDKDFNSIFYYVLPSYANSTYSTMALLNNGNIISQITTMLPDDSLDYDFLGPVGEKLAIKTLITDPVSGEVTEVELNALIKTVSPISTAEKEYPEKYAEGLENLAVLAYITEDKHIDTTSYRMDIVSLGNDGSIGTSLKLNADVNELPMKLSDGYYIVDDIHNTHLILDSAGTIVNRINGDGVFFTDDCIYDEKSIYNFKGEVIFNIGEVKGTIKGTLDGNPVVVSAEKGTYIYKNGKMENVSQKAALTVSEAFYTIEEEDGKIAYYNVNGDKIVTAESALSFVAIVRDGYVLRQASGAYYKFGFNIVLPGSNSVK